MDHPLTYLHTASINHHQQQQQQHHHQYVIMKASSDGEEGSSPSKPPEYLTPGFPRGVEWLKQMKEFVEANPEKVR